MRPSPIAGEDLMAWVADGGTPFDDEYDALAGATDCPDGCVVEPDGHCPHGFQAAELSAL